MIPFTATDDNFDDVWEDHVEFVPDLLETMFAQQQAHLRKYSEINPEKYVEPHLWGNLDNSQIQAALRENAGYAIEELMEAISGHLKNKPWKQTHVPVDREKFTEELADVWHFLIQFMILAGYSPLDTFKAYFSKSLINEQRRENGY